jgi:hypothetical protein
MPLLLIVSLVVIGGLVLLLGGLVLLVVCSGINNLSDDAPRRVQAGHRAQSVNGSSSPKTVVCKKQHSERQKGGQLKPLATPYEPR